MTPRARADPSLSRRTGAVALEDGTLQAPEQKWPTTAVLGDAARDLGRPILHAPVIPTSHKMQLRWKRTKKMLFCTSDFLLRDRSSAAKDSRHGRLGTAGPSSPARSPLLPLLFVAQVLGFSPLSQSVLSLRVSPPPQQPPHPPKGASDTLRCGGAGQGWVGPKAVTPGFPPGARSLTLPSRDLSGGPSWGVSSGLAVIFVQPPSSGPRWENSGAFLASAHAGLPRGTAVPSPGGPARATGTTTHGGAAEAAVQGQEGPGPTRHPTPAGAQGRPDLGDRMGAPSTRLSPAGFVTLVRKSLSLSLVVPTGIGMESHGPGAGHMAGWGGSDGPCPGPTPPACGGPGKPCWSPQVREMPGRQTG